MQKHVLVVFHSDPSIFQLNSFLMTPSNEMLFLRGGLAYTIDHILK